MKQSQVKPAQNAATNRSPYQAPVVRDLGAWQSLTLIYSVPVNPGSPAGLFNFQENSNGY